ncbi:hypothetical protein CTAYLR_000905 [Chrysophaeum taylorii]|uniref:DUF4116 domain-containing protein n=1 Tax=Chrysophaeum taylorii TaxID=2483200 RepID=A0AAD7UFW5_9STRA|nr:hypothetical protein CTAYLR_000905 [Chrysophaeum taylorii]
MSALFASDEIVRWIAKRIRTIGDSRVVRSIMALLCLLPLVDIVSDIHQTVFFAVEGWVGSFSVAFIVMYCSWRFGTLYAGCHPKPTWDRVFVLYVPGLVVPFWEIVTRADPSDPPPPQAVEMVIPGGGTRSAASDTVETGQPNGDDELPTRTLFNLERDQLYIYGMLEDAGSDYGNLSSFKLILYFEAKVFCLVVIFYLLFLSSASFTLAREALMRADKRPPAARQHEIYSLVLACFEGLLESAPQLVLQITTYRWAIEKNLDEPFMGVSYTTWFAVSAFFSSFGVLKAAVLFGCNFAEILDVLAPSVDRARVARVARARRDGRLDDSTPDVLKKDKNFVLAALREDNGWAFQYAAPELRKDKNFVLSAVREDGRALRYAAPELRKDEEVVLAALRRSGWVFRYAAPELRKDKEVVLAALRENGRALEFATPEFKKDKEVVLAALRETGRALEFATPELRSDKEVVLAAVRETGRALEFVTPELRSDKEVVLAAVRETGRALEFVTPELRSDKEVVLAAVRQRGHALEFATPPLRSDKEVVLAAVRQHGHALEHAAPELKRDKEVVLAAVSCRGFALKYAELQNDKEVVLAAVREYRS